MFTAISRHHQALGTPLSAATLTRTFRTLAEQAGLPPVRLHDLRHGAATLALAAGWTCARCRRCSAIPASC